MASPAADPDGGVFVRFGVPPARRDLYLAGNGDHLVLTPRPQQIFL